MNIGVRIYVILMLLIFATQIIESLYIMSSINSDCDSKSFKTAVRGLFVTSCIGFSGFVMYYLTQQCKAGSDTEYATNWVYIYTMFLSIFTLGFSLSINGNLSDKVTDKCRVKSKYSTSLFNGIAGIGGSLLSICVSIYWIYDNRKPAYRAWKRAMAKKDAERKVAEQKRAIDRLKRTTYHEKATEKHLDELQKLEEQEFEAKRELDKLQRQTAKKWADTDSARGRRQKKLDDERNAYNARLLAERDAELKRERNAGRFRQHQRQSRKRGNARRLSDDELRRELDDSLPKKVDDSGSETDDDLVYVQPLAPPAA